MDRRLYILNFLYKLYEKPFCSLKYKAVMMYAQNSAKYLFLFSFFALCIVFEPKQVLAQNVLRIAAVVNDDVISAHDLAQRIRLAIITARMKNTPEVRKRLAPTILRTMVDERLKEQEGKRLELEVTETQIQQGLAGFAQSQKIPPAKLQQALAQMGVDPEVLEDQARAEILWGRVITRESRGRLNVSENEINAAMAAIESNKGKPEYLYSEIFLPIETASQESSIRQMIERLFGHIQNGASFSTLARDFSQSTSASRGGNLGWVQSGNIPVNIESILSQIPINGYSNPIRSVSGFYLLHLRDKRISGQEDQDEILTISQAYFKISDGANRDEIDAKRGLARRLTFQAHSCDQFDQMAKELGAPRSGRVENINLSKMPPQLRALVTPLGRGLSAIQEDKEAFLALMVCERENVAPMPDIAKRKIIKNSLRTERIGRENRRLLQKLRRAAFVDIRL